MSTLADNVKRIKGEGYVGRDGKSCVVGFSSRKGDISVYSQNAASQLRGTDPKTW